MRPLGTVRGCPILPCVLRGGVLWGRRVSEGAVVTGKGRWQLAWAESRHLSRTWFQASLRQGQLITSLNCLAAPPQGWAHSGTLPKLKFGHG